MMDLATGEEEDSVHALLDYARRVATRYAYAVDGMWRALHVHRRADSGARHDLAPAVPPVPVGITSGAWLPS